MKEVKKEIYGTRDSVIAKHFIDNQIKFIKNIWFVTCRRAINSDRDTRYLVLLENDETIDLNIFFENIPVYRVFFSEKSIDVTNVRKNESRSFSGTEFKNWIIDKTCCKFIKSYASGSTSSTKLSIFFRENMGKGFSLSDVDFFITNKSVFIEEKQFIEGDKGYLGEGQFYTFREIQNDICKNIDFHIILNDNDIFYLVEFSSINQSRFRILPRWGKMIEYDIGPKLTIGEILNKYS